MTPGIAARFLFGVLACGITGPTNAQHGDSNPALSPNFGTDTAYQVSQQAIDGKLGNHSLVDTSGSTVELWEVIDRPTVVSMIYTSCHHVCPTLTRHLRDVVEIGRDALGEDSFNVLTVGFDTAVDTPGRMSLFAAERGIDQPRWHFLSADEPTISALAAELGFLYQASPQGFDHITQATLIDANRTVTNQVYGVSFDPPLLIEPMKYLLRGQILRANPIEGWWRDIKLLCTVYDPSSGRYHFDYSLIIAIIMGASSLVAIGVFVIRSWRYNARSEA